MWACLNMCTSKWHILRNDTNSLAKEAIDRAEFYKRIIYIPEDTKTHTSSIQHSIQHRKGKNDLYGHCGTCQLYIIQDTVNMGPHLSE